MHQMKVEVSRRFRRHSPFVVLFVFRRCGITKSLFDKMLQSAINSPAVSCAIGDAPSLKGAPAIV